MTDELKACPFHEAGKDMHVQCAACCRSPAGGASSEAQPAIPNNQRPHPGEAPNGETFMVCGHDMQRCSTYVECAVKGCLRALATGAAEGRNDV